MKIVILSFLLVPVLASAQPYQSPATVAKRLKTQCAALAPQQRAECEKKAKSEIKASIDRHHELKRAAAGKPAAKPPAAGLPKAERKGVQMTVPPRTPQK